MVSQIKVNEIIKQSGSSISIGESGDTVSIPTTLNATTIQQGGSAITQGITNAEQWGLTSDVTLDSTSGILITPFSRYTSSGGTSIGTSISSSSGTFSFGQTGIYNIRASVGFIRLNHLNQYIGGRINYSTNGGSNYSNVANLYSNLPDDANTHASVTLETIVDVTSTSDCKIQLRAQTSDANGAKVASFGTSDVYTGLVFIRLGDT